MSKITRRSISLGLPAAALLAEGARAQGAAAGGEDARLLAFLDKAFDEGVALSPQTQTSLGLKTQYDKLDDYTPAASDRALALLERQVREMKAQFAYGRLSPAGQLNYRLFETEVEQEREAHEWRWYGFAIRSNGTPAGQLPSFLINQHRIDSAEDARAYVARLVEVERVMGEIAARVRRQAQMGITPPKMVFAPARADARLIVKGAPFEAGEDSTVLADFRKKVAALKLSPSAEAELAGQASAALKGPFKRGYDTYFALLDEIEPKAKGNDGAWSLPRGEAYYDSQLRRITTTKLTADEIHRTGLAQVARIHGEMEQVKRRVGFAGTLQEFFVHMRTAPQFKYSNDQAGRDQFLADSRKAVALGMAQAPRFFRVLPKAALEVRPVEAWRQETASAAFYERPAPDGSRPGIYYVNLADMTQVPKPNVEAYAHHEGAPGHHFQIARAQELTGLPKFRRMGFYGAYIEGWGLYSERLAQEMGAYKDPYGEFGMLTAQLWRAIRMVVDTGLHAKRWSREQAVSYFRDNSPLSERDVNREVDRYINSPGQATSYMVGQLRISALREKAAKALGPKFDIRDFHEVILANGALPLDVLEAQVDGYISAQRRR
jgi:uncharacterized protein (DUF885 family)